MRLRIFISSPGDVPDERLRVGLIIDKLAQEFRRYFDFEAIRWEHEPLIASGHFQDALDPPSEADIVVLILWSRLGTPLPDKTAVREYRGLDGRAPVTGTEWEYEDALKSARERGAPDLLAFRNVSPAPIDPRDPDAQARSMAQLGALNAFWRRHFSDRGVFLAAYDEYTTLEQFAARLEELLRKLIERRIAALPAEAAAATWFGPPFRGLQAYGFEHAAIYFGRDEAVARSAEQLAANARAGTAFLLVCGASGSGKSSLVQAALLPRLMRPQRIEGLAFTRRFVFRPGGGSDPLLRLIEALTRKGDDAAVGLPELLAPGQTAAELAAHLRQAPDTPAFVVANALARVTEAGRASRHLLAFESARLMLVIDQLEELFTAPSIGADDRRLFARLLAGLSRSGLVWVVATVRADFWHRVAELPELLELAQGAGRIDLVAPSPAELAEMIRKPALAARLAFETREQSGLGLDVVIAADAIAAPGPHSYAEAAPGVLPLLSFLLDALYEEDVVKRKGSTLTSATYAALGGLQGAMAMRAEATVESLPVDAQAAVPRVLRALVTIAGSGEHAIVARTLAREQFAEGSPTRAVVEAFTAERLVVAAQDNAVPTVRLAHEALISHWPRARQQFATDRRDLETRTLVEQQQARWTKAAGKARQQLLLRDPDLANALDLAARLGEELDAGTRAFIAASRQRARLRQRLTAAAAAIFAAVALAASVLGVVAYRSQQEAQRQRERAEQSLAVAIDATDRMIYDLAQRLHNVSGVPIALVKDILDRARALQEQLTRAGATPALRHSQAVALTEIATTLLDQGDTNGAFAAADRARQILQDLLAADPGNTNWQRAVAVAESTLGDVQLAQGNLPDALKSFQASLAIVEHLAHSDGDNPLRRRDLAQSYQKIGIVQQAQGSLPEALKSYQASVAISERLAQSAPDNADFQHDLLVFHNEVGEVQQAQGNLVEALQSYQAGLAISEPLAARDRGNALWRHDLSMSYNKIGEVKQAQGSLAEALTSYQASLAIREALARGDVGNASWQRELSVAYEKIGEVKQVQRSFAEALTSFQASLAIRERLVSRDPNNAGWQRDLAVAYNKLGGAQQELGNLAEALKSFEASLAIVERLIGSDPSNALWQSDLAIALVRISFVAEQPRKRAVLERALATFESLDRAGKLNRVQQNLLRLVRNALATMSP